MTTIRSIMLYALLVFSRSRINLMTLALHWTAISLAEGIIYLLKAGLITSLIIILFFKISYIILRYTGCIFELFTLILYIRCSSNDTMIVPGSIGRE
ncbi:hypothetical protein BDN70DRAFT_55397 [Pholiota conissans]|uniref:Uncharacterized protein n=1 Tax=Pholiota conissans TaxID=109636 RepID=A0A9P5ZDQ9_9AGAR|nr:hypothetical protein BDN70DRAFT_55397 [Pholiota conissans]